MMTDKEKLNYISLLYYNLTTGGDDNIDEEKENAIKWLENRL